MVNMCGRNYWKSNISTYNFFRLMSRKKKDLWKIVIGLDITIKTLRIAFQTVYI